MDSRARPGCGVVARGAVGPPGLRLARESLTGNALVPGASRGGALPQRRHPLTISALRRNCRPSAASPQSPPRVPTRGGTESCDKSGRPRHRLPDRPRPRSETPDGSSEKASEPFGSSNHAALDQWPDRCQSEIRRADETMNFAPGNVQEAGARGRDRGQFVERAGPRVRHESAFVDAVDQFRVHRSSRCQSRPGLRRLTPHSAGPPRPVGEPAWRSARGR